MLFAQAVQEIPSYLNVVMNAGALAILGYHLLVGLPKLFERLAADHRALVEMLHAASAADRQSFEQRAAGIEEEIRQLRDKATCKYQP